MAEIDLKGEDAVRKTVRALHTPTASECPAQPSPTDPQAVPELRP